MATLLLPKAPRNNLDVILGYRTPDIVSSIRKTPSYQRRLVPMSCVRLNR
jgi:hypothetical protein